MKSIRKSYVVNLNGVLGVLRLNKNNREILIRWGRAIDKQMNAIKAEHEKINSIYRRTLRKERMDLHDEEANSLMRLAFWGWWTGRSRVPSINLD